MGPIFGGLKQYKSMVIFRDFPYNHVWVGNIMIPDIQECELAMQHDLKKDKMFFPSERRSSLDFVGTG